MNIKEKPTHKTVKEKPSEKNGWLIWLSIQIFVNGINFTRQKPNK